MISYRGILTYKGTNYHGFQAQADQATIQGHLNAALDQILPDESHKTLGSGRTDAGVHAIGQVVKIDISKEIDEQKLIRSLNAVLPNDIQFKKLQRCEESFHPILHADWKEYQYFFTTRRDLSPFEKDFLVSKPYTFEAELMDRVCQSFIGKHDFQNYFCVGTETPSTVREIFECDLSRHLPMNPFESTILGGEVFVFRVRGSGFLKQMVRLMVSVLWDVGRGKIDMEDFNRSLKEPLERHLAPVAPPQGLYLSEVHYSSKKPI